MKIPPAVFVPILAVLTLACSAASGTSGPAGTSGLPSDGSSTGSLPPAGGGEQPPADILDPVIADAAARAGVDASQVTVVSSTSVEWSDGSLGCPQPGMTYTQALVGGFQVILRAAGRDLDYRVRGPGRFKLCDKP